MKKIQVTDDVADILRRSAINGNKLTLPGQLPRPDYVKVMKVIDAAGGKWSKKEGCHIFPDDPSEVFADALITGKIADNSERAVRSAKQAFYTPSGVADRLIEWACIQPGHKVLEPSAGAGALIRAIPEHLTHVEIVAIESDEEGCWKHLTDAKLAMRVRAVFADFLECDPISIGGVGAFFDRVLMNPPFTKGQDVDHVTHAFRFLKTGGWLLAIMSRSFEHHSGKKYAAFRDLLAKHGSVLERLTNGEFKESGTSVDTVIVRLIK